MFSANAQPVTFHALEPRRFLTAASSEFFDQVTTVEWSGRAIPVVPGEYIVTPERVKDGTIDDQCIGLTELSAGRAAVPTDEVLNLLQRMPFPATFGGYVGHFGAFRVVVM